METNFILGLKQNYIWSVYNNAPLAI